MDIGVVGASGRMGQMVIRAIDANPDANLKGASERKDHPWIGQDVGVAAGGAPKGVIVADNPLDAFRDCQAIIDFSLPAVTLANAEIAAQGRMVHVIGTTGFTEEELAALDAAARHATIIRAGNMSLGVNLLTQLVETVARALDVDYDIEVVEAHHRHKIDAPSGTALMLGDAAAKGRGISLSDNMDSGRDGITGARKEGDIGFSAIRGGDIIGEHDVMFAGNGERIILRHVATDRMLFANGAVKAALWGEGKAPGNYTMVDVLGLS